MGTPNVNDLFSDDNVQASMMEFGKGMQKVMINFQDCTEKIKARRSRFSAISDHIKETKRLRNIFRQFVKESLKFNEHLSNYSLDILFFVKCFKDYDNYSDEDILELMYDLLEKSQENHDLSKELKNKIKADDESGINDQLINIQNSLSGHIGKIKDEINREKISALIPKGEGIVSATTRYFIALFFDVKNLYLKLDEIFTIKDFDNSLTSIILEISKIETFWDMQSERIKYLIDNLSSGRDIQRQRVVHNLEKKWKNVGKECQIYNRVMRDVLNRDRLICIEVKSISY
ncbi:hypothetical protein RhiirA5_402956 [Rhizophagus irregularis]|uniref:Uncharacterized protein n=1 Tax=Rhizophagus irregularis TaxID=588596 RepID=A0A2N0P2S5_9GLOM|nr:hypothetical protein RhiirA5_402956 [Rhizophagus irregularis]